MESEVGEQEEKPVGYEYSMIEKLHSMVTFVDIVTLFL